VCSIKFIKIDKKSLSFYKFCTVEFVNSILLKYTNDIKKELLYITTLIHAKNYFDMLKKTV